MNLERLQELNGRDVFSISSDKFKTYGKIVENIDFSPLEEYMAKTEIPESGNIYVPSTAEMESLELAKQIKGEIYGGMDVQIGYCNGRNSTFNGFEYHKSSEITYAITDFILVLGHVWDIENNTYDGSKAQLFFVPKGTGFELYQTSLHLSPCKTENGGFKSVIILPKGTNIPFEKPEMQTSEGEILLYQNKWIICHKDREPLVRQGAKIGLVGENVEVKY